jgi:formate dehydrogenase subunit gamma
MIDRAAWLDAVERTLAKLQGMPGGLLPILRAIQEEVGYVPPESVPLIAESLNLSRAEVHGVISFYHDFRTEPPGRHIVHVCRAESCQSVGAEALLSHACEHLGVDVHGTSADGAVTLEPVYCLGNCALSPAVMVDHRNLYGRVTADRLDVVLDSLRSGR